MKMKNLIGGLMVAIVTCLTLPAIATPPDSPPKAEPAALNVNAMDAYLVPALTDYAPPAGHQIVLRAPLVLAHEVAIIRKEAVAVEWSSAVQRRSATNLFISLEWRGIYRTMNVGPPQGC